MADEKILYVSTDQGFWNEVRSRFGETYAFTYADNGEEALKHLEGEPFTAIVSGLNLPGMNGLEFLAAARRIRPSAIRMVLTGAGSMETVIEAVNKLHVYAFLTIPCSMDELGEELEGAVARYARERSEAEQVKETLYGGVKMLVDILEMVTPEAMGRSSRIRPAVRQICRELGFRRLRLMDMAVLLSHIGCVGLPPELLHKLEDDEELTKVEKKLYKSHPSIAAHLLGNVPRMGRIAEIVRHQNTPCSADPPLGARILRACIYFDAMWQKGHDTSKVLAHMAGKPETFDKDVVAALSRHAVGDEKADCRRLKISDLEPGMVMAADMMTEEGAKLLLKGQTLSEVSCMRLQAFSELLKVAEPVSVALTGSGEAA